MSGMNGTGIAASNTTTVPIVTQTGSPDSFKDPKVVAAYVCFGVGAFIIIVAVVIIIIFLVYRRRTRQKKQMQQSSSLNLDDYKFPGTGNHPISTISDSEERRHVTKLGAPDYNFTGNGYRFPLATIADKNVLTQRHPLDDENSLPVVLPTFSLHSTDSISPYPSRSSGEISTTESGLAETEGYVRLHRSSPLAGINAIYSSSGELSPDYENTPRKTSSSESRDRIIRDVSSSRRSSLKRVNMTENARNLGNGPRFIGTVNEGFVSDDYYEAPKVMVRNNSLRTSLDRLKRERATPPTRSHSSRKSSVLLENLNMHNGVYHVSLRHDGSSVTQTSVVKHPT